VYRMQQAVVVRLFADVFSISQETPTQKERLVAEQIKTQLCNEDDAGEFNTLMIDDDGTDDGKLKVISVMI